MVRKGGSTFTSNYYQRPEATGRIRKTPVVLLKRLNIPLDSKVLVKDDDSIVCVVDSPSRDSREVDIIEVSGSDNSEDEEFQKLIVKRFQSTRGNNLCKIESISESVPIKEASSEISNPSFSNRDSNILYNTKPGPASRKKLIAQTNALKRKGMQVTNNLGRLGKYDAHKKSFLLAKNERNPIDPEGAEKDLERKIERAGFIKEKNLSRESAPSNKLQTEVNNAGKDVSGSKSSISGKKAPTIRHQPNKSYNQTPNAEQETSPLQSSSHDTENKSLSTSLSKENVDGDDKEKLSQTVHPNNKSDFTPSRISERIKNKKVKFSALKLLAGGDFQAIKKELNAQKHSTPKKTVIKTKNSGAADINANSAERLSPEIEEAQSTPNKPAKESNKLSPKLSSDSKLDKSKARKNNTTSKSTSGSRKQHLSKRSVDKSLNDNNLTSKENESEEQIDKSAVSENSPGEKTDVRLNGSKETLKSPTTANDDSDLKTVSDKVKVQLKGVPQKKIVNISITPSKGCLKNKDSSKQKLDLELGPDIIIRRVRCEKKSDTADVSEKNTHKGKLNPQDASLAKNLLMSNNLRIKNLCSENPMRNRTKAIEEVEVPPQIKKLFVEASKNKNKKSETKESSVINTDKEETSPNSNKKKKLRELQRKKLVNKNKSEMLKNKEQRDTEECSLSDTEIEHEIDDEQEISELVGDVTKEPTESAKKSFAVNKSEENKNYSKNPQISSPNVGKKTAKVTPLRQSLKVPPKSEVIKKPVSDKMKTSESEYKKIHKSNNISDSSNEIRMVGSKRNYSNAFEKYFICADKICEHNDSLDSDSSVEVIDFLSHFVDLKRKDENERNIQVEETSRLEANNEEEEEINVHKHVENSSLNKTANENCVTIRGKGTINEIIRGVTADLPNWSFHVPPENSSIICLILLERDANGTLALKKCIEIDSNFKANVYVNRELVSEYCGIYDSFDAIKNLIYQVDLL